VAKGQRGRGADRRVESHPQSMTEKKRKKEKRGEGFCDTSGISLEQTGKREKKRNPSLSHVHIKREREGGKALFSCSIGKGRQKGGEGVVGNIDHYAVPHGKKEKMGKIFTF